MNQYGQFSQFSNLTEINACASTRYGVSEPDSRGLPEERLPTRVSILRYTDPEIEHSTEDVMEATEIGRAGIEKELALMERDGLVTHTGGRGSRPYVRRMWRLTEKAGTMYQPTGMTALALSQCFGNYTYRSNTNGISQQSDSDRQSRA